MSVLRFDPTTASWVVFAPSRIRRPQDQMSKREPPEGNVANTVIHCPFCPGNEEMTPQEIYAVRASGSRSRSDWQVRVVPNKFPALQIEADHHRFKEGNSFRSMGGCGAHEVIIESQQHSTLLAEQPPEQIELILRTALLRSQDLLRDRRFQAVIVFKNHGAGAGTSLKHPHWQLIATPVVPRLLRLKHSLTTDYFDRTGECLYCVLRDEELTAEKRIVATNNEFVALAPYASHLPFEIRISAKGRKHSKLTAINED